MIRFARIWNVALLVLCAAAALLPSGAAIAEEVTLKAISAFPEGNWFSINFDRFVARVNAEGKGLVKINYLGGGPKVMPPFEVGNAAKTGVADMVNVPGGYYSTVLPEGDALSLSTLTPAEMRRNGAYDYINRLWGEKMNVRYLGRTRDGVPVHVFLRKPILKPDFTGLRLRVVPLYRPFFEAMNAQSLINIPPGEVYTAMERGVLDGYGWPLVGLFDVGLEKQTKYRVDPGMYTVEVGILVNLDTWKKLSAPQRAFLEKMTLWIEEQNAIENPRIMDEEKKKLAAAGMETIAFTGADAKTYLTRANDSVWGVLIKRSPEHGPKLRALLTGP